MSRDILFTEPGFGKAKSRLVLMQALRRKMLQEVDDVLPISFEPGFAQMRRRTFFRPFELSVEDVMADLDADMDDLRQSVRWQLSSGNLFRTGSRTLSGLASPGSKRGHSAQRSSSRTTFWDGPEEQVLRSFSDKSPATSDQSNASGTSINCTRSNFRTGPPLRFSPSQQAGDVTAEADVKSQYKPPVGVARHKGGEPRFRSSVTLTCVASGSSRGDTTDVEKRREMLNNKELSTPLLATASQSQAVDAESCADADVNGNYKNVTFDVSSADRKPRPKNVIPIRIHRMPPRSHQPNTSMPSRHTSRGQPLVVHVVLPDRPSQSFVSGDDVTLPEVAGSALRQDRNIRPKSFDTSTCAEKSRYAHVQLSHPAASEKSASESFAEESGDKKRRMARSLIMKTLSGIAKPAPISRETMVADGETNAVQPSKPASHQITSEHPNEDSYLVRESKPSSLSDSRGLSGSAKVSGSPTLSLKSNPTLCPLSISENKDFASLTSPESRFSRGEDRSENLHPNKPYADFPAETDSVLSTGVCSSRGCEENVACHEAVTLRQPVQIDSHGLKYKTEKLLGWSETSNRSLAPESSALETGRPSTLNQSSQTSTAITQPASELLAAENIDKMASTEVDVIGSRANMLSDERNGFQFRLPSNSKPSGEFCRIYRVPSTDEADFDDRVTDFFGNPAYEYENADDTGNAVTGDSAVSTANKPNSVVQDKPTAVVNQQPLFFSDKPLPAACSSVKETTANQYSSIAKDVNDFVDCNRGITTSADFSVPVTLNSGPDASKNEAPLCLSEESMPTGVRVDSTVKDDHHCAVRMLASCLTWFVVLTPALAICFLAGQIAVRLLIFSFEFAIFAIRNICVLTRHSRVVQ